MKADQISGGSDTAPLRPRCSASSHREELPERPLRQWVLSLPHALRFLLATDPDALTLVLGVVSRTISRHLINKAGLTRATGGTGR